MAYEMSSGSLDLTFKAGADLSSSQYKFVELSAADTVTVCNGATDLPIGVLQNAPASGENARVRVLGITKLQADAALATVGTLIGTSADGQADAKTVGTDTTEYVVGVTLSASANAGEIIAACINCLNPHRAS